MTLNPLSVYKVYQWLDKVSACVCFFFVCQVFLAKRGVMMPGKKGMKKKGTRKEKEGKKRRGRKQKENPHHNAFFRKIGPAKQRET